MQAKKTSETGGEHKKMDPNSKGSNEREQECSSKTRKKKRMTGDENITLGHSQRAKRKSPCARAGETY